MLDTMHNPLCIIHPPLCGISLIVRGRGGGAGEGPRGCRMDSRGTQKWRDAFLSALS